MKSRVIFVPFDREHHRLGFIKETINKEGKTIISYTFPSEEAHVTSHNPSGTIIGTFTDVPSETIYTIIVVPLNSIKNIEQVSELMLRQHARAGHLTCLYTLAAYARFNLSKFNTGEHSTSLAETHHKPAHQPSRVS